MPAVPARSLAPSVDVPRGLPQPALNRVRRHALKSRATRRIDLFRACQMLSDNPREAGIAFADALIRTLAQGLGRAPVFFRPGSPELSFDERWLMSLIDAARADDLASFEFLLRSRLARHAHRHTAFLVRNLAARLDTL